MVEIRIMVEVEGEPPLEFRLGDGDYAVGRDEACELFIENDGISRRHAKLVVKENGIWVEDLGSSNGTFLDEELVAEPTRFESGQLLVLGAGAITVRIADPGESIDSGNTLDVTPVKSPVAPTVGPDLSRSNYFFRGEIARGGMGTVLEAEDRNTGRIVALKKMLSGMQSSEESNHRFVLEARVMAHLEHPNIVPMHDLGVNDKGVPYYTMKRVRGVTLQDVINGIRAGDSDTIREYPLGKLLEVFQKVCDGIAFAHAKGVVHRDLKPENVMLGEFGEAMVMDWGLAKVLSHSPLRERGIGSSEADRSMDDVEDIDLGADDAAGFRTMEGAVMGTPNYMAPEQAKGLVSEIDERSDIFSLGGILYTILTLRSPVGGNTVKEVLTNMATGYIPPPIIYNKVKSARLPGSDRDDEQQIELSHCPDRLVPEALSRVTMRAMKLDKAGRYQKIGQIQKEIEAWQGGFATQAEEASLFRQMGLFVHRNKALAIAAGIVIVSGAFFFTGLISSQRNASAAMAEFVQSVPFFENEARTRMNSGEYEAALKQLEPLLTLFPDGFKYRIWSANLLQALGRYDEADVEYKLAKKCPDADKAKVDAALAMNEELNTAGGPLAAPDALFDRYITFLRDQERMGESWRVSQARARLRHGETVQVLERLRSVTAQRELLLRSAVRDIAASAEQHVGFLPEPIGEWAFEVDARGVGEGQTLDLRGDAVIADGVLRLDGDGDFAVSRAFTNAIADKTMEVWLRLPIADTNAGGIFTLNAFRGPVFESIGFGRRKDEFTVMHQHGRPPRVVAFNATTIEPGLTGVVQVVLRMDRQIGVSLFMNGTNSVRSNVSDNARGVIEEHEAGAWKVELGAKNAGKETARFFAGEIEEARVFGRALSDEEVQQLYLANPLRMPVADLRKGLSEADATRLAGLDEQVVTLRSDLNRRIQAEGRDGREALVSSLQGEMLKNGCLREIADRLELGVEGLVSLSISRQKVSDLSWLRGIPIEYLNLDDTQVADLRPLKGAPLQRLFLRRTPVADLSPLAGAPLRALYLNGTKVENLGPLKQSPIELLDLQGSRVTDLGPLKGLPLKNLILQGTSVTNLGPLAGAPLTTIVLQGCHELTSVAALADAPLRNLYMADSGVKSLAPIGGAELEVLHVSTIPAVDFQSLASGKLRELSMNHTRASNLEFVRGNPISTLWLVGSGIVDFGPLAELPLRFLTVTESPFSDVSLLAGKQFDCLDLSYTKVSDLKALKGTRIRQLLLHGCKTIHDLSPLLEVRGLTDLSVPADASDIDVLRNHPTLKKLAVGMKRNVVYQAGRGFARVDSVDRFWKKRDANK